jgi:hypothetical protein
MTARHSRYCSVNNLIITGLGCSSEEVSDDVALESTDGASDLAALERACASIVDDAGRRALVPPPGCQRLQRLDGGACMGDCTLADGSRSRCATCHGAAANPLSPGVTTAYTAGRR